MALELTIVLLVVSALCGAVGAYLAFAAPARAEASKAKLSIAHLEANIGEERQKRENLIAESAETKAVAGRVPLLEAEISKARTRFDSVQAELVETKTNLEAERKSHAARIEELAKMGAEIERKFAELASKALDKNSQGFLSLVTERFDKHKLNADKDLEERQKAIQTLITPISEHLSKFENKIGELEKTREGAYRAITEQVKNLAEGQTGLRTETNRLVQALRQPKTRGRWGEYQLRNVLEMAGMTEYVDFLEQHNIEGEQGRLRPDVIVKLPGGKSIVVDAKTPLDAYISAIEVSDEEERKRYIEDHARQLQSHVRSLGTREYWKALPVTPDFVVMFVPGEAFFAAAIESNPDLFEDAVRKKVLISTPTTFIALVKAIAYGWQQEKLAENAEVVAGLARDLFGRIKVFGEHMGAVGQSLRQAVERYNKSVGSLEGRVLPAARKFESLGVAPTGTTIAELAPVELEPREVQAAELLTSRAEDTGQSR